MRVYDVFMYCGEANVLQIKLDEAYEHVDYFVIVEAEVYYNGNTKPIYFDRTDARFLKYLDKVKHYVVPKEYFIEKLKNETDASRWRYEIVQRDYTLELLQTICDPNDIIIYSDADEIYTGKFVSISSFLLNTEKTNLIKWGGNIAIGYLNLVTTENIWNSWYRGHLKVFKLKYVTDNGFKLHEVRFLVHPLRDCYIQIMNGWHLSWQGTIQEIIKKLNTYAHSEFDTPEICNERHIYNKIHTDGDILNKGERFEFKPIDNTYPDIVKNNINYYKSIGMIF